ncbi:hypothetical protein Lal_00044015 [Lupinus albus]|uniref:Putative transcription factor MADS-type1 family n=1 Tax=Lupinus albus TaxID=3870 RepID=A0A6A4PCN3_LUPAL|nr:putative transcription factor MADS-type1 family [Lupinus albus]KAF1895365.1 hypothetical protein Lal_00044015 [Lupinus albus]
MAKNKGELTYIEDDSKRKTTCKKRKASLVKKMNELTTLCGIEACAIIYDPNESQPEVWPSHPEVQRLISKLMEMPEMEQKKYMFNHESFLSKNLNKARDQLKRVRDENKRMEMELFMFQCLNVGCIINTSNTVDTNYLLFVINQTIKDIQWKESRHQRQHGTVVVAASTEEPLNEEVANVHEMEQANMGAMQLQDWSSDSTNDGGNMMLPFGDNSNFSSGFWPSPSFP